MALAAAATLRLATDLARRAVRLHAVAPQLRTRGAAPALRRFLEQDAIAPVTLLEPKVRGSAVALSDRAARRLCERLATLGAVRELTGRSTFRLYGL